MKKINEYLNLGKIKNHNNDNHRVNKNQDDILHMVQNDGDENAAYETYDFSKAKDKYKKGFISLSKTDDSIVIQSMNNGEDFAKLLMSDDDSWDFLDDLPIGEKYEDRDETIIRIW